MRSIDKQNAIRRMKLKFIKITTFEDKALATKMPEMRDGWLASKAKLKGSQIQDRAQEDSLGDITSSADSFSPKVSRSPMLIEHRPRHLN
jgi:hypothetical protein